MKRIISLFTVGSALATLLACSKPTSDLTPSQQSQGQISLNNIVVGSFNQATASLSSSPASPTVWIIVLTSSDTRNTSFSFSVAPTASGDIPEGNFTFDSFLYDGSTASTALFWIRDVDPVLHTDYHANGASLSIKRQNQQYVISWTGLVRKGLSLQEPTTYGVKGQYMGSLKTI